MIYLFMCIKDCLRDNGMRNDMIEQMTMYGGFQYERKNRVYYYTYGAGEKRCLPSYCFICGTFEPIDDSSGSYKFQLFSIINKVYHNYPDLITMYSSFHSMRMKELYDRCNDLMRKKLLMDRGVDYKDAYKRLNNITEYVYVDNSKKVDGLKVNVAELIKHEDKVSQELLLVLALMNIKGWGRYRYRTNTRTFLFFEHWEDTEHTKEFNDDDDDA